MKDAAEALIKTIKKHYTAAIVLAAGNSTRMGKGVNKQAALLRGVPVLAHTLMAYQKCPFIREITVVTRPSDFEAVMALRKQYKIRKLKHIVAGGSSRQESAQNGLKTLDENKVLYVAIADGARCLTTPEQIARVCVQAYLHNAASAAHRIADTVKRTTPSGVVKENVDRENLWAVQTPQIFHYSLYTAACMRASDDGFEGTDDNSMIEHLGYASRMVECGLENMKITTADDLKTAEAILLYREMRT